MKVFTFYTLLSFLLVMWNGESSHQKKTTHGQKEKKEQTATASSQQAPPVWGFESASFVAPIVAATKTAIVTNDVAPLGLPSPGDQLTYTVEITNTGNMDATSVNFLDNLDPNVTLVAGSLRCSPVPMPDSYNVLGNVKISVPAASGLLSNDQNPCNTGSLSVTTVNTAGTQGQVTFLSDGSFTFNPAAGFNGTTTFTYTVTNGVFAKTGTVTLTVSGRIWFIDNNSANGDGRLGTPFSSIANFNSGASGGSAGDIIFMYRQTASNYTGAGLTLKNNQYLIGQGAASSIVSITGITLPPHSMSLPSTGGTNPVIAHNATAITLASGNKLHGLDVSNTGGTGVLGASVGNLTIRNMSVTNAGGTALNFASGALDVIIKQLNASNTGTGFALSSTTGSFLVEGTGTTDFSGGVIQSITTRGADIQTATNITLKNMRFLNANTADAGGAGTCDATSTLACNAALYLRNITGIELNNVDVDAAPATVTEEQGLNGDNISGLTITDCLFTKCGDEQFEGAVKIRNLSGTCSITNSTFSNAANELVEIFNTSATATLSLSVTGCTFSDTFDNLFGAKGFYFNGTSNQTRNILIDNCNFTRLKSQGVYINANANTLNADVTDCIFNKDNKKYMDGVHILPQGTCTANINILRNTLTTAGGSAILVSGSGTGSVFQARVNQNMITGPHSCLDCIIGGEIETAGCNCYGDGITVWATENSSGKANVTSNTINGLDFSGRGVYALARNQADLSILIQGNNVSFDTDSWQAYDLFCGNSDAGQTSTLCVHLTGNTLNSAITSTFTHVRARAITNVAGSTSVINLQSTAGSANMANVWDNNGNTPLTTAVTNPVTVNGSTSGAGTETITYNHPGCSYTLTHPTAIAMPEQEYTNLSNTTPSAGLAANTPQGGLGDAHITGQTPGENDTPPAPQAITMMDMVTVSGFTLPATTGAISIEFKVTINTPFPQGVCSVSNQGTVSGSNFSDVLTDNPFVTGSANPTVTPVNIAPEITTCPSTITKNNDAGQCYASTTFAAAANIGCPTPTLTYKIGATTITSPHNFNVGTTTVTVIASNGVAPNDTCMFNVVVTDTQAPDITCLSGTQARGTNLGNCSYTVQGTEFNPTVAENCPGYTLTNNINNTATLAGEELPVGTTTVTWTISDGASLTDVCSVTIQVSDDDSPTITCPAAAITPCNIADLPPYANLTAFTTAGGSVSDNCGINNASFTMLSQTGGPLSFTRTYQITDVNGLSSTCTQTVTVSDNVDPIVTPGTIAACYSTVAAAEAAAIAATTATDNCGGSVTKTASTSGTCSAVVTVTATDGAGNDASTTYNTRIDNTAPVVTQGTINACYTSIAAAEAAALAATSATDNCPGALTEVASTVGTCSAVITVTTSDICGNSAQVTYNTSIDNANPTVTPGTIAACYQSVAAAEAAAIAATTVNDDCPSVVTKTASTSGTCSAVVTVTATDACGNSAQTTYNTRIDNAEPIVTQGTIDACYPTVAAAEAAALAATSATDNCPGALNETVSTTGTCSAVVTVTTTDGCGNSAQVTYNTRIDNTAPVVTPGTIASCYLSVAAAEAAALAATTTSDNCPGTVSKVAVTTNNPDCEASIVITATDGCGNAATTTYTTRIDNTNPTVTPGTIAACYPTVAAAEAAAIAATTATDGCPGAVTKTASTSGTCSAVVTVTATDACGNSAQTTYNTRIDNTAPVVTQGTINACYTSIAAAEAAALAATSATDNCPGALTEVASTVGTCSAVITVTTTDMCGNSAQVTYNTSIDNANPTVTPGTIAACYQSVAAAEAAAIAATTVNDDCPSVVTKTASTTGTCSAVVTVTAMDACGNSAQTTYNTRIDNTAPVVTQGTINACYATVAEAEAAALAATSATDNCTGALNETVSTTGTCSAVVTVTTTDGCGNSAQVMYNTRIDNTAPVVTQGTILSCYPTIAAAEAAALAATSATDNCPGTLTEAASTVGTCSAVVTITTSDGCGNSTQVTYNTRIDNTAPTITPGTIASCYATVAAAEAAAIAATTATDGCPGAVTKTASTTGTCSAVVTVTATDVCGNSSQTTYNTRIDNTAPVVTQGTINACYTSVAAAEAAALAATSATDNCPGTLTETASTTGSCSAVVTVTTTDGCGNSTVVTYNTRVDNAGPSVTTGTIAACYQTVAAAEAAAIAATTASDDCPSSVTKTASTSGTCSAVITVTATDGCGNTAQTTYNTRIDNTAPVVTQGTILGCYATVAAAEAAALAATSATDNCPGALTETASTTGTCSAVVTVTTTDGCGNSAQVTYNTRIDNTAPVVTQGTILSCYPTLAAAEAAALAATSATDNCPGSLVETASTVGTCSAVVTVTTTDGCGNSAQVTYNTRIDNTAPVITPGTIAPCYTTVAAAEAAAIAATTATDACPGTVTKTASTSGTCSAVITVTATDACGNSSQTTYNTNIDNTAPNATAGTLALCYNTVAAAQAAAIAATNATDNCPGTLTKTAVVTGTCSATIVVTVSDPCGNSTQVTYNTRVDNVGPTVTPGTIANCYLTQAAAEAAALAATTVVDDCPSSITKVASTSGTCNAVITVTATDGCGNSSQATYNTRIDNTPPSITCKNGTVTLTGDGNYTLTASDVLNLTATSDNCGSYTATMSPATVSCANKNQTIPVVVTVTDLCGNSSTCTANVTVVEGTALPSGWVGSNIGVEAMGSSIFSPCTNGGNFVLNTKGYTTNTTDIEHAVYRTVCGNTEIVAHVTGLAPSGGWAGIQMRESTSQGSKKFTIKTQLNTILRRETRATTFGATTTVQSVIAPNSNSWLKITRSGSTFTAYSSNDGINWTFRGSSVVSMNSCIQVGIFAESYNNTTTTTATFDNVAITGGAAPLVADTDQGIEMEVSPVEPSFDVHVYPNPTNDGIIRINFGAAAGSQIDLEVYNGQGQRVVQRRMPQVLEVEDLNLSNMADGVYLIRVNHQSGATVVKRVVVSRTASVRP